LVVPFAEDPPAAIARAITNAPSQVDAAGTGDHDKRRTPCGQSWRSPEGSYSHTWPTRAREARVASNTSGLVAVETTAPGAASTDGITIALVLPERGGPRMRTACSGCAVTQVPPDTPR